MKYDFSGYATRNDLKCADGRIIRHNAFLENDGKTVPLVWQHCHDNPSNVIGHALLENRDDGVYAYGLFNDTAKAQDAKELVRHGDVRAMSIYANRLRQDGSNVVHGIIREVSLVLAGANPGAYIDNLNLVHGDGSEELIEDEAIIWSYDDNASSILHSDDDKKEKEDNKEKEMADEKNREENQSKTDEGAKNQNGSDNKTIGDVIESMTEEQKKVLEYLVTNALEENASSDEGEEEMKHNVFDGDDSVEVLSHDEMTAIFDEAKHTGSLKDAVLAHGIENIGLLMPEAKAVSDTPDFVARPNEWVAKVWNATRKTPFSRIKTVNADITMDEARARGYIKGNKKVEEQFSILRRVTTPQTVYKLQKLDRDDVLDITDFNVVAWLKQEMRMMLDEELARAILVGDGRLAGSAEKINPQNIRPVYHDEALYTIHRTVDYSNAVDTTDRSNALVEAALRSRKEYRGSGSPTFYTYNDVITDMMLATDKIGRKLYSTEAELAAALRVKEIVEIPVMEGVTREDSDSNKFGLVGLIVNLADYNVGADKGGEVNLFDDFDINYNKYEYLIETRCSGALIRPYSAIALEVAVDDDAEGHIAG